MELAERVDLPRIRLAVQRYPRPRLPDLEAAVHREIARLGLAGRLPTGARVAVTAGSRGIAELPRLLRAVVRDLRALGAQPFLVPAMGSHGGATPEGQLELLAALGVTEASVEAPIRSSLEVVALGESAQGVPVYCDRLAAESDGILVVNRVKTHTDFTGPTESGLCKMIAIGLGKHRGAITVHRHAVALGYIPTIHGVVEVALARAPILGGLAVIENAYHEPARLEAVPAAQILRREPALLAEAAALQPRLPFDSIDLLLVDELGKDISGNGMDTKVIGRMMNIATPEPERPRIKRIIVRDITPASHGNASGVGLADFTTARLARQIDPWVTNVNNITAITPEQARLPIVCTSDQQALAWALQTIGPYDPRRVRLVWIRNTLALERCYLSSALAEAGRDRPDLEISPAAEEFAFDAEGNLVERLR